METIYAQSEYGETVFFTRSEAQTLINEIYDMFWAQYQGPDERKTLEELTQEFWSVATEIDLNDAVYDDTSEYGWESLEDAYENGRFRPEAFKVYELAREARLALDAVLTASEAADEFALEESTVRQYLNRNVPYWARKSGGTWLVTRKAARSQWGSKQYRSEGKMKTAYATIDMQDDQYVIGIDVTNGELTSSADGWTEHKSTLAQARLIADAMLADYCADGECVAGGIKDRTESK